MLYGEVVGKIFERFYRDKIWSGSSVTSTLLDLVRPTIEEVMRRQIKKGGVFDWEEKGLKPGNRSLEEVEAEIVETIPRGVQSIKHHRLVGMEARAEVVLDTSVGRHRLGGRADFIIRRVRPHSDLVLVDGKGSRWRDRYTDDRQLRWYAMLYQLKKGVVPDRLGFLFWRSKPEESVDWVDATQDQLDDLRKAALEAIKEIELARSQLRDLSKPGTVFGAAPSSNCQLCDYLPLCPEGAKALSEDTKAQISEDRKRGVEEGEFSF